MYSTKLVNKNKVEGDAYCTVGDPFKDAQANPFRQPKKGEKLIPFQSKVRVKLVVITFSMRVLLIL